MLAFTAPILLFIAFLLLLLVSLSLPIIKSIFLFSLAAHVSELDSSASVSVKFGVWGYCTSGLSVSVLGFNDNTAAQCTKPHLGYNFDSTVASVLHVSDYTNIISKASTAALVLHPIACGLTFLAFVISLFIIFDRSAKGTSRIPSFFTLGFASLAALITSITFLVDVILVAIIRTHVHNDTHGDVNLTWGNATWMVLGAAIAIWIALCGACAGVIGCGGRTRQRKAETY